MWRQCDEDSQSKLNGIIQKQKITLPQHGKWWTWTLWKWIENEWKKKTNNTRLVPHHNERKKKKWMCVICLMSYLLFRWYRSILFDCGRCWFEYVFICLTIVHIIESGLCVILPATPNNNNHGYTENNICKSWTERKNVIGRAQLNMIPRGRGNHNSVNKKKEFIPSFLSTHQWKSKCWNTTIFFPFS